jgi:hypothetical protein
VSFRDIFRRWRLYYRSGPLFRETLAQPRLAYSLPWVPAGRMVEIAFRSGRAFTMRAGEWPVLPIMCKLERLGAEVELAEGAKRVRIDGLTLFSPLWDREEAWNYKEVLIDDVYGIKARDLAGRVVVDVGGYVGDSAAAFARRGARVHACEPSETFCAFMRRNLAENGLRDRVTLHEVGLAEREHVEERGYDRLRFVEGVAYTLAKLPRAVELLKLDCEGSEYHLLSDVRFLEHLAPREIRLEYHRGPEGVLEPLERAGYEVTVQRANGTLGLVAARALT